MELTADEARDLVAAYALDALDEAEQVLFDRHLLSDAALTAEVAELREVAGLLAATEAASPPPPLAERTLSAAFARRSPGVVALTGPDPIRAYRRQMDDLAAVLADLAPADWSEPTLAGFTVHELVSHLLAVEGYVATLIGAPPPVGHTGFVPPAGTDTDHVAMTLPTVAAHAGDRPATTVATWRAVVDANLAHLDQLAPEALEARVSLYGIDMSLHSLLGTRVFEVWTHTDDIRRAVGRALPAPEPERLRLMSDLAVGALPLGLLMAGIDDPGRTVRVILTGDGGGEWLQHLRWGADAGDPDATLVADVVDFCRLAAQRLTPDEIAHRVEGDEQAVRDLLVGAQVFAA